MIEPVWAVLGGDIEMRTCGKKVGLILEVAIQSPAFTRIALAVVCTRGQGWS